MEQYDYREAIKDDIRTYIKDNDIKPEDYDDKDDLYEQLNDDLFTEDSVTGNASGSYTFNRWEAEENLCHNMDLLAEAFQEFGEEGVDILEKGAEACDVTIRCYLLSECLSEVIDELYNN